VPQADILEVAPPKGFVNGVVNFLFGIKHIFVEGLSRALPDPYAELATGLLTGDQHGLGDALVTTLALSGLIWVVVLSGYHVTLIATGVLKIFSFLPRRFGFLLAGLSILAIIFATGASAPSLRGGIMACLTLYARSTNRTYDALRALCASLILILLWNPFLLAYDSGFQLSIVVTPALLLGVPALEGRLLFIKNTLLREIVAVSTIAQLACVPLILWQTGELGIWAIPANMFVMSFVPVAMIVSGIAGAVGVVIPPLAPLASLPAYTVLSYILFIAKTSAALPFADVILPPFPFALVVAMYGILIWIVCRLERNPNLTSAAPTPPRSKSASR
jgi:competence protein ComEC